MNELNYPPRFMDHLITHIALVSETPKDRASIEALLSEMTPDWQKLISVHQINFEQGFSENNFDLVIVFGSQKTFEHIHNFFKQLEHHSLHFIWVTKETNDQINSLSSKVKVISPQKLSASELQHDLYLSLRSHSSAMTENKTVSAHPEKLGLTEFVNKTDFLKVLNASQDIFLMISLQGVLLFANKASQILWASDYKEKLGHTLQLTSLEKDKTDKLQNLSLKFLYFLAKTQQACEIISKSNNDTHSYFDMHVNETTWNEEPVMLINMHNVSHLKKVALLTAEVQERSRLNKLKDEFISIVSHEMRTPLTIIKGAVSNLLDGIMGPIPPTHEKVLKTTMRNVDRLARIINDLLDLSRLESGRLKINRRKTNLNDILTDVHNTFQSSFGEKKISLELQIDETIPDVFVDNELLTQVMFNLLQNALRYAKSTVRIRSNLVNTPKESGADEILVEVIDDGEGIKEEAIPLLFNKFEQIDRPSGGSGYKGTGLGLAICKKIMDLHNTKIEVDSSPGYGTRFYFKLSPYQRADDLSVVLDQIFKSAEAHHSSVALIKIAIHNLDKIDTLSSEQEIANLIRQISFQIHTKALRRSDMIQYLRETREFLVVLPNSSRSAGEKVIERILQVTKDCFCQTENGKIFCELKMGLALYPDDSKESRTLLDLASKAAQ